MTREILFRGKASGEWLEGGLVPNPNTPQIWVRDEDGETRNYIVDPDTLGQYIGLKDKNGRKIFEGDILRDTFIDPEFGPNDDPLIVRFKDFRFEAYDPKYQDDPLGLDELPDPGWWEIIGNIWDNQELVKEGTE